MCPRLLEIYILIASLSHLTIGRTFDAIFTREQRNDSDSKEFPEYPNLMLQQKISDGVSFQLGN